MTSRHNEPGEFSVCQFFPDGSYEYVRRHVSVEAAMWAFKFYTNNVAARLGIIKRVIVTDGGDCINFEWKFGEGIVYPNAEALLKGAIHEDN